MKTFRTSLMILLCGACLSLALVGCGTPNTKQDTGTGGKGLTDAEKTDKQGK